MTTESKESASLDSILIETVDGLTSHLRHHIIADAMIRKLGKRGVRVTTRQRERIVTWLIRGAKGAPPLPRTNATKEALAVAFTPREWRKLRGRFSGTMAEFTDTAVARLGCRALKGLRQEWRDFSRRDSRFLRGFERRLARTWRLPFELLEMQLDIARSVAAEVNAEVRRRLTEEKAPLVEALTSLHARACQIGAEVLVLLHRGYAEGAMARWRSLHEVTVVLIFIDKHGARTARRYLEHDVVESWKAAVEYAEHCGSLGFDEIDAPELAQVKQVRDAALKKHGPPFKESYGWAARDFGRVPKFADLEKDAGLAAWRPFYRLARNPVHANPKALRHRLGVMAGAAPCLPLGPSNYGLADPGQNTGLSLAKATSVLMRIAPISDERIVLMSAMRELSSRIAKAFVDAQHRIEQRETKLRASRTVGK